MAERAYTTANSRGRSRGGYRGPNYGHDRKDPGKPEYWEGKDMVLKVGACVARVTVILAEKYPEEVDAYREGAQQWLRTHLSFSEGVLEEELDRAQNFSARQGWDFMVSKSEDKGLWDLLLTDFIRVFEVMES